MIEGYSLPIYTKIREMMKVLRRSGYHPGELQDEIFLLTTFFNIKLSKDVQIARIVWQKGEKPYIEINSRVVNMNIVNFIYILSHEVLHFSLSHFYKKPLQKLPKPLANLVADIEVNAYLDRNLEIIPTFTTGIATKITSVPRSYFFFLYTISGKEILKKYRDFETFLKQFHCPELTEKDIERWVWFKIDLMDKNIEIDIQDIIEESKYWIKEEEIPFWFTIDVATIDECTDRERIDRLIGELAGSVLEGEMDEVSLKRREDLSKEVWKLAERLKTLIVYDSNSQIYRLERMANRSVVPCLPLSRREIYLRRRGIVPVFHERKLLQEVYAKGIVHIYVDVSGSFMEYIPYILGLLFHLRKYIGRQLYQFSTEVKPFDWENVRKGNVETTGGTDIGPVYLHATRMRFQKILIFTDGEFDRPDYNILRSFQSIGGESHMVLPVEERVNGERIELWRIAKSVTYIKTRREYEE